VEKNKSRKAKILVVDDDDGLRGALRIHLESVGYEIDEACDGKDAMEKYQESMPDNPYDLILLDMIMDQVDGVRVIDFIRSEENVRGMMGGENKPIPIIMVTALPRGLVNAPEESPDDYINKPFEIQDLVDKIEKKLKA